MDDLLLNFRCSSNSPFSLFESHEGLLLEYEEALTRSSTSSSPSNQARINATSIPSDAPYVLSAHTIWLGDRTRQLDGAHIEFFRGIKNPIGIKVGPTMKPDELVKLLEIVDPFCEKGRVTLICRYGATKVSFSKIAVLSSNVVKINEMRIRI